LRFHSTRLVLAALLAALASPAAAQVLRLEAAAGHTSYAGVRTEIDGPSAMLGVSLEHGRSLWGYGVGGTPLDGFSLPWLAAGIGGHPVLPFGRIWLGAELGAHGYAYTDRIADTSGHGAILNAQPAVGITTAAASLAFYSGLLHHETRSLAGDSAVSGHDSSFRITLGGIQRLAVDGDARRLTVDDEAYHYAGARLRYNRGTMSGWASVGGWLGGPDEDAEFGGGGSIRVRAGTTVQLAYRRESADPFYESTPRRSWSLGVSQRLGSRATRTPAGAVVRPGALLLRVPLAEAPDGLAVAGDFSGWEPVPMIRTGQYWSLDQSVPPGVYRYAFRRPDGSWFVPSTGHRRVDDGMGGEAAVVIIP
jgi:hypothetical protein